MPGFVPNPNTPKALPGPRSIYAETCTAARHSSIILHVALLLHDDTFRRLCRGRDLLASEYQSRILLEQAAREACLSEFHFHRLFRATFGETPHDFLTRLRMDRAKQMLASSRTVTDVCFEIGYGSLGSFSSKFRAQFGRSPAEFQREVRRIFGYSAPWRVLMIPTCFLQSWSGSQ